MLKRKGKFANVDPEEKNIMKGLNSSLVCPMNYVCEYSFFPKRSAQEVLPMEYFFNPFSLDGSKRRSKKLEDFVEKYCSDIVSKVDEDENFEISERNFDEMMEDLRSCHISKRSIGVMSNLLNRAFRISAEMKQNKNGLESDLWRNKPVLIKLLYSINRECLLKCFSKNLEK